MSTRLDIGRRNQSGVVLFIALIVLVAMTLAGIAIMRSVDTGVAISGNVAFKQSTLSAADRGIDDAFQFLTNNVTSGLLDANYGANAYYAEVDEPDWSSDGTWSDAKEQQYRAHLLAGMSIREQERFLDQREEIHPLPESPEQERHWLSDPH